VLRYLPANLPRLEIAAELSVPVNTASTHIRSIHAKLQVSDRSSAVQMLVGSRAGSQQNERLSAVAGSCGLPAGALRRARGSRRGGQSLSAGHTGPASSQSRGATRSGIVRCGSGVVGSATSPWSSSPCCVM